VDVVARPSAPLAAIGGEGLLELFEEIVFRAEVAEMLVAFRLGGGLPVAHVLAVVAVEGVALDEDGIHLLAPKNLLEGAPHGRRAAAGRPGDRDDGVLDGHRSRS
jgi:hypothetical protein